MTEDLESMADGGFVLYVEIPREEAFGEDTADEDGSRSRNGICSKVDPSGSKAIVGYLMHRGIPFETRNGSTPDKVAVYVPAGEIGHMKRQYPRFRRELRLKL